MRRHLLALLAVSAACGGDPPTSSTHDAVTTCVTLPSSGDTLVSGAAMTTAFGTLPIVRAGGKDEGLVRFELASIPAAASLAHATLRLTVNGSGGGGPVNVHRATAAWSEATETYASFAQHYDSQILAAFATTSTNAQKSMDVSGLVRSWLSGAQPNDGILLESSSDKKTIIVSREGGASQQPQLEVCYTLPDDHCTPNPCENNGSCTNTQTGFTCACAPGFTGATCDTPIDNCAANPCLHGGTCSNQPDGYTCSCPLGYTGASCETLVDNCASAPCENGGTCVNGVASYTCQCPAGYTGASCEMVIDNCAMQPCVNGGTCTNAVGTYTCSCPTGFTGTNCETNVDDCAATPCQNGGTCVDGIGSFTCTCAPGWGGATCEVNLDTCAEQPCMNGGSCLDGYGTYTCACAAGYTGTNCEIDIDDCASQPCENGGVCIDGVDSYTCSCPNGTFGSRCEITQQLVATGLTFQTTQGVPASYEGGINSLVIATVTDRIASDTTLQATIDWGDGSAGTTSAIFMNSDGSYSLYPKTDPDHWYATAGTFDVTITFTAGTGAVAVAHSTALVAPQLVATGTALQMTQGIPVGGDWQNSALAVVADARPYNDTLTAMVDWGDGSAPTQNSIFSNYDGTLTVYGKSSPEHYYANTGTFNVTVTITSQATAATVVAHAIVIVGPQLVVTGTTFDATRGAGSPDVVIATVTDARQLDQSSLVATIDWGDGNQGTTWNIYPDQTGSTYDVYGKTTPEHAYAAIGAYDITVTVTSQATGATAVSHSTAVVKAPTYPPGTTLTVLSASPQVVGSWGQPIVFTASVTDGNADGPATAGSVTFTEGSTVLAGPIALDATGTASFTTSTLLAGLHSVTATYTGPLLTSAATISEVVAKASSTTTLTSSAPLASFGQPIMFSVSVASDASVSDGTVQLRDGATVIAGPVPVVNNLATFTLSTLSLGTHNVSADFSGSAQAWSSTWSLTEIVQPAITQTTLRATPSSIVLGQTVSLSIAVTSAGVPPDGSVRLKDGATVIVGPVPVVNGVAQLTLGSLALGAHGLTAEYLGSATTAPSAGGATVVVLPPPLTVSIDSGPSRFTSMTSATFTFSANHPATFQCQIDGTIPTSPTTWQKLQSGRGPCTSPTTYSSLTPTVVSFGSTSMQGGWIFTVFATDQYGQTVSQSYEWAIEMP